MSKKTITKSKLKSNSKVAIVTLEQIENLWNKDRYQKWLAKNMQYKKETEAAYQRSKIDQKFLEQKQTKK